MGQLVIPNEQPTVVQALNAARLEVGSVGKDDRAPAVMGGYRFRGVDATVNATSHVLARHGVLVTPEVLSVERAVTSAKDGKAMLNVYVLTRYTFHGPGGDTVTATVAGEASDAGDKATAKAQSVALRVALLQALLLPTDDVDPDAEGYERAPVETEAQRALRERRQAEAQPPREARQAPQDGPGEPQPLPAHLHVLQGLLNDLHPDQQAWVRRNWGDRPPLARLTVAQAAATMEWLATVPPPNDDRLPA